MDEGGPGSTRLGRRIREACQEFTRAMERSWVFEADERSIPGPLRSLGPTPGRPRDVEIHVTTRHQDVRVGPERSAKEAVPNEMSLTCVPVDHVNSPGVTAVQLTQTVREPPARELHDEVVVVQDQRPGQRDPAVLVRCSLVEA